MVKAFFPAVAAFCAAVLLLAGCDQSDISAPVVFDAALDPSNVYEVGSPIRFNFTGNAENITFFSGEVGHQFRFKDRYEVPVEDVISARLVMNVLVQYSYIGAPGAALSLYKSNTYDGVVTGTDFQSDSLYTRKILAEGLKDWKLIDTIPNAQFNDSPSRQMYWAEKEFVIEPEEVTNLSFFIWFHPISRNLTLRKKIFMAGDIYVEMKDVPTQKYNFRTLDWKHFFMAVNPLVIDPYAVTTWSASTPTPRTTSTPRARPPPRASGRSPAPTRSSPRASRTASTARCAASPRTFRSTTGSRASGTSRPGSTRSSSTGAPRWPAWR